MSKSVTRKKARDDKKVAAAAPVASVASDASGASDASVDAAVAPDTSAAPAAPPAAPVVADTAPADTAPAVPVDTDDPDGDDSPTTATSASSSASSTVISDATPTPISPEATPTPKKATPQQQLPPATSPPKTETPRNGMPEATYEIPVIPVEEFAKHKGIGGSFLTMETPFILKGISNNIILNPVGFLMNVAHNILYNKVGAALYILLQEYLKRFDQILAATDSDDKKIIYIISLRELFVRTLLYNITGWCCVLITEKNYDPLTENVFEPNEPLTVESVKEHYFTKETETFEILEQYIWNKFTKEGLQFVTDSLYTKSDPVYLSITQNNMYSPVLGFFIEYSNKFMKQDSLNKFYGLLKSQRTEESLRYFKDLMQTNKELGTAIDALYSTSISPVRFVHLGELADYICKQLYEDAD